MTESDAPPRDPSAELDERGDVAPSSVRKSDPGERSELLLDVLVEGLATRADK